MDHREFFFSVVSNDTGAGTPGTTDILATSTTDTTEIPVVPPAFEDSSAWGAEAFGFTKKSRRPKDRTCRVYSLGLRFYQTIRGEEHRIGVERREGRG